MAQNEVNTHVTLDAKYTALVRLIDAQFASKRLGVVALSGGVDSALVAHAAGTALGNECVAVTVQSEFTTRRDFSAAVQIAESIGMEHHPLIMRMLDDPIVRCNGQERCYYCKQRIFRMMQYEYGDNCLLMDGTNADDDPARPGRRAVREFGVLSPLERTGLTKAMVRRLAKHVGLHNWDAPSESCLATRLPADMPLDVESLERVRVMEDFFHERGVETLRAYHDNLMATVVFKAEYADIMRKNRDKFMTLITKLGLRSFEYKVWNEDAE